MIWQNRHIACANKRRVQATSSRTAIQDMVETVKGHWRVPGAYAAIGAMMYGAALGAFFVSDDFEFLTIVASAKSWLVIFEPLVGRFERPLVVLTYYVCYRLFGLHPLPYHLLLLAVHVFNTWCVYLIARRLLPGADRTGAFLTGLLFLVFSSHSEAVGWVAGVADPLTAACLLPAFLAYLRALDPGASVRCVWIACLLAMAGAFAKEAWVVFPAIVLAHGVLLGGRDPQARRRVFAVVVSSGAAVFVYLAIRRQILGSVTGGYSGLATGLGSNLFFAEVRAFLLRSVIPAGPTALNLWWRHVDLVLWPVLLVLLLARGRGEGRRVAIFAAAATIIALSPMLPLSISMLTTESERFTYVPTAFSCLFIVGGAGAILQRRALVVLACLPLLVWHGVVLERNVMRLADAGRLARGIIDTFAAQVREHDPAGRQAIYILNLPDNLYGVYVFRRGFYPAIQLFAPDVASSTDRTTGISTYATENARYRASLTRLSPNGFDLHLGTSPIVQPEIPSRPAYRIVRQTPVSFEVAFSDAIPPSLILFTNGQRVAYAGSIGAAR
jgi:hypothetical protein